MKYLIIFLTCVVTVGFLSCELILNPDDNKETTFIKFFEEANPETNSSLSAGIICEDSGYLFMVNYDQSQMCGYDKWIVKLNSDGKTDWEKIFDFSYADRMNSIIQNPNNGYVICGSHFTSDWYGTLFGLSGDGEINWMKSIGVLDVSSELNSIVVVNDEKFVATGEIDQKISLVFFEHTDFTTQHYYSGWGNSILLTSDGGYLILGSEMTTNVSYKPIVIKTDSDGNEQWTRRFSDDYYFYNLLELNAGYILVGRNGYNNAAIVEIDVDGIQHNEIVYPEDDIGAISDIEISNDGNMVICGSRVFFADDSSSFKHTGIMAKLTPGGSIVWSRSIETKYEYSHYKYLNQTSDGGFVVFGTCRNDRDDNAVVVVKTDENGHFD